MGLEISINNILESSGLSDTELLALRNLGQSRDFEVAQRAMSRLYHAAAEYALADGQKELWVGFRGGLDALFALTDTATIQYNELVASRPDAPKDEDEKKPEAYEAISSVASVGNSEL
jgi:hypothetical protein